MQFFIKNYAHVKVVQIPHIIKIYVAAQEVRRSTKHILKNLIGSIGEGKF